MGALLLLVLASADASEMMETYGDRVVEVQVLGTKDANVDARTVIGSGFWLDEHRVVTNFHVVSQLVWWPNSHRLQVLHGATRLKGKLLDIDPPHDLAIIEVDGDAPGHFTLAPKDPERGADLFSLGHPHDIGLSIVDGTFNGHAEGQLEELLHFTGALNPGMSGGPCIDEAGNVVGVNVATRGNEVSFLVPAHWVKTLYERVKSQQAPPDLIKRVSETVVDSQQTLTDELLSQPMTKTTLSHWELPAGWPAKDLRAWGGPLNEGDPDDLFSASLYQVSGEAMTVLRPDTEYTGQVAIKHRLYEANELGSVQLYRRAGQGLALDEQDSPGYEEEFHTKWSCDARVFTQGGAKLRSHLCMRAYKKLDGVYDYMLRVMTFDEPRSTVVSELQLYGFSIANAQKLQQRFVEAISWKR